MKYSKIKAMFSIAILAALLTSCNATMHTVGNGGSGDCKSPSSYDAKKKQWYILYGLVPLNRVDSKDLAGGAQNYTIRTTTSFGDYLISIPGAYLLGIKTQTVRVSKGK
jgi:predicted small secreted protein